MNPNHSLQSGGANSFAGFSVLDVLDAQGHISATHLPCR